MHEGFALALELRDAGLGVTDGALHLVSLVLGGDAQVARREELRLAPLEGLGADVLTHRRAIALFVEELLRIVDRLQAALFDIGEPPLVVELAVRCLKLRDFALLRLQLLIRRGEPRLDALELSLVDGGVRVLDLLRGELPLHVEELALILLPFPRIVVPDHPNGRQEQRDGRDSEEDVESADVVRVSWSRFRHGSLHLKY